MLDPSMILNAAIGSALGLLPIEIPVLLLVFFIRKKLKETGDLWGLVPQLTVHQRKAAAWTIARELDRMEKDYNKWLNREGIYAGRE